MTTTHPSPTPPENPHCKTRWPHSIAAPTAIGWWIAEAQEASYAAVTLAKLLEADSSIAHELQEADDPASMPAPFKENVRGGLFCALNVCASAIAANLERIADLEVERAGKREAQA